MQNILCSTLSNKMNIIFDAIKTNFLMKKSLFKLGAISAAMLISSAVGHAQNQNMTAELLWKLGRVSGETISPEGDFIYYGVTNYDIDENKGNRDIYKISIDGGNATQITKMPGSEYNVVFSNGKMFFLNGGQIYSAGMNGENPTKISEVSNGISHFKLSPNGQKIAFTSEVKIHKTTADLYPNLPKAEALVIDDLMYRHWDHWEDEMRSHVFVADFNGNSISDAKDIMEGEPFDCPQQPFGGAEDFQWNFDNNTLAYVSKKLTGKEAAQSTNSDIYLYNLTSNSTVNFTKGSMGYDTHPIFSPDGKMLSWLMMPTPGYESDINVIMSRSLEKGEKFELRAEWTEHVSGIRYSNDGSKFYVNGGKNATYQIYSIPAMTPEEMPVLTPITEGTHNIGGIIGEVNGTLYATQTTMNRAAEIYSYSIKNGKSKQLTTVNDAIYSKIKDCKVEERWVETTDGKKMLVWVIFPPNFDKNKRYPSLLYCQGGPQSAVSQFYSFRWNFQLMASEGYIVIAPNRRGLPTFGEEWNRAISKDWGGQAMHDYMRAVEVIREEPYIDRERIGAVGASYGGYSVYMLAGMHGGMFSSFISHCGLFNLESWYGTTEELFFANFDIGGPYWDRNPPKSYAEFSPHNLVKNWGTPMMVIHGGNDFRVPINQGMEAFQAAQLKGIKSKFLYYPNEGHWVLKPQNGLIWHSEFFKWLDETVKNKM